ncbi:energy transducer TonB [Dyadobacter sp. CY312]|uniref:energy transducer TonB n=1 Tax=Dyadobacter sp. CY312 TaxID=2907303 RepID=UPI001F3960BB|nr:energy transducer TonB [Dyadobacter sp. CY312]MCE7044622.1 M56 family metallopeptidase [Dyadobacter sp. CY312]
MTTYFITANLLLIAGYGFYKGFLANEVYFTLNRISLILLAVLSFCIPAIPISPQFSSDIPLDLVIRTETIPNISNQIRGMQFSDWLWRIYFLGVLLKFSGLILRLYAIRNRIKRPTSNAAFSFFKYKVIDPKAGNYEVINYHEDVHIKQWHSLDILFFEVLAVVVWFNPAVYLYQMSIKRVHEFLADQLTATHFGDRHQYALILLGRATPDAPGMTNQFLADRHMLKWRISMLSRHACSRARLLKYVLLIPLLFCLSSFSGFYKSAAKAITVGESTIISPVFPGGLEGFQSYLFEAVLESEIFKAHHDKGKVLVHFIVDSEGKVVEAKVKESPNTNLSREAVRIISNSPKWSPGYQNSQPVRVGYEIKLGYERRVN